MISDVVVEFKGEDYGLSKRYFNVAQKQGLEDTGYFYHKAVKPRHFDQGAQSRYHYAPRSQKYNQTKKRRFGHSLELVFSGTSMNRELTVPKVFATSKEMKIRTVVKTWNFKSVPWAPNMFEELSRTTKEDRTNLVNTFADAMRQHLLVTDIARRTISL